MKAAAGAPAEPFFLKVDGGQRFCLYHPPAGPARGTLLYVHPFAEELNRARRMAALQARAFAAAGHAVLQIDLAGCGDSSGDFGDARWELWKADLALAAAWLRERTDAPLRLWGLRLGALLALDYARTAAHPVAGMLLWQPVLKGSTYLTQFLRLRLAGALLADGDAGGGTAHLRAALLAGEALEIAGYDLDPRLARALEALEPLDAFRPACPVDWIEAVTQAGAEPSPGAARAAAAWRGAGVDLRLHPVHCAPFWTTTEITENAAWLETGTAALEARLHGH
ncbi:hydrolase 2, exosortase A system-associated [Massilia oculi]|jgi:exosortase A-associated hydrolase 2|uniref:Hydrolase 2, exosortase A system-associated n=1 Tax=Massilia oculi TaxID=945844 RepID=A0A2S2DIY7_9BURK|nr:hydrolase 2, exosortase A system-associated [Massilia oculi]AWL05288.1 hydrolase 2, exosortase A system-associated [Massilia oculi]